MVRIQQKSLPSEILSTLTNQVKQTVLGTVFETTLLKLPHYSMKQAMKLKTTHSLIENSKTLHLPSSHVSWPNASFYPFQKLKRLGIHAMSN